jgi:hypothetical protein
VIGTDELLWLVKRDVFVAGWMSSNVFIGFNLSSFISLAFISFFYSRFFILLFSSIIRVLLWDLPPDFLIFKFYVRSLPP